MTKQTVSWEIQLQHENKIKTSAKKIAQIFDIDLAYDCDVEIPRYRYQIAQAVQHQIIPKVSLDGRYKTYNAQGGVILELEVDNQIYDLKPHLRILWEKVFNKYKNRNPSVIKVLSFYN